MKRIVGILFLSIIMITTISFAAYPSELEETENDGLEVFGTLEESDLENYDDLVEPISEEDGQAFEEASIIYDDIYRMGEEVTVNENVDANVYVMGENVKIDGAFIYGNLYVMANKIEIIDSEIEGSIYALGENISFSGSANDIYACASNIDFDLDSYIWRSAKVGADTVNMNGNIGRNLYASVNNLSIGDNATIEGSLNYYSANEGNIAEQAKIGEVNFEQQKIEEDANGGIDFIGYLYDAMTVALKTLIVALIIVFFINKFNNIKRTNNVATDLLKATGKGTLVFVVVPIIFIILICSIIGVGLGFALMALYIIAIYIATSTVSLEITHRILNKQKDVEIKKWKIVGISILISLAIWAIGLIPVIGGIIKFILILMGLGIWYTIIFQRNKKETVNEN